MYSEESNLSEEEIPVLESKTLPVDTNRLYSIEIYF